MTLLDTVCRTAKAFLATASALVACLIVPTHAHAQLSPGESVPQLLGVSIEGKEIQASEYAGKVLTISSWASWCSPCREELPMLEALQRTMGRDRLQVVAINIEDKDTFRRLKRSLAEYQILLTHDRGGQSSRPFFRQAIPHMVIVGRDGRIRKIHLGYDEESLAEVVNDVSAALAEK